MHIALGNEYKERCQENLKTKLAVIKEYKRSKKYKKQKEVKSTRKMIRHEEN